MTPLSKRFWVSTVIGSVIAIAYRGLVVRMLDFSGILTKPPTPFAWIVGTGLLILTVVGMNLFFWVFILWNGCLGRTGVYRLTLLFALFIHGPAGLGYLLWFDLPINVAMVAVAQGISEVLVIGLAASLIMRSDLCDLPH